MSFLLVLAAAVTLVVGLLQSGLTLIYLSIGCSVVAGLVLAIAVLRGRPEPKAAASAPARPYSPPPEPAYTSSSTSSFSSAPESDESWRVDTPAPATTRRFGRPAAVAIGAPEPDEEPEPSRIAGYARRAAGAGASTSPSVISSEMPPMAGRGAFPIPDFDDLRAPELLRRLDDLDVAQLEQVRAREESGKARVSILSRIDTRIETMREPGWEIDDATWEGGADAPAAAEADLDEGDDFEDEPEPPPAPAPAPAAATAGADFPITSYDSLRVGQILPLLRDLDDAELDEVRQYEAAGKNRSGILDRIDSLAGGAAPPASAAAPPAAAPPAKAAGSTSIAAAVAAAKAKQAKKG